MKKWFTLLFILAVSELHADESSDAMSESKRAILAYPIVKEYIKNTQHKLMSYIPLPKEYLAPIGTVLITASTGKIDTKPLRMDIELLGGNTRPNVIYNFKTEETIYVVNLGWSFQ